VPGIYLPLPFQASSAPPMWIISSDTGPVGLPVYESNDDHRFPNNVEEDALYKKEGILA
jgi:hypothetical protein